MQLSGRGRIEIDLVNGMHWRKARHQFGWSLSLLFETAMRWIWGDMSPSASPLSPQVRGLRGHVPPSPMICAHAHNCMMCVYMFSTTKKVVTVYSTVTETTEAKVSITVLSINAYAQDFFKIIGRPWLMVSLNLPFQYATIWKGTNWDRSCEWHALKESEASIWLVFVLAFWDSNEVDLGGHVPLGVPPVPAGQRFGGTCPPVPHDLRPCP